MMELINKEVALISKADKAIAEAKEQSNNYFDEMKAAKDERHKRMMQRREQLFSDDEKYVLKALHAKTIQTASI